MNIKIIAAFILVISCFSSRGQGVIVNRDALNTLLGSQRADEDFESFPLGNGEAISAEALLSSTNPWAGSLNAVIPGVTFESPYNLEWYGNNVGGSITKTIAGRSQISVDFWDPTIAFGIDVKDFASFPRNFIGGVIVYGADDTTILYTDNNIVLTNGNPAVGVFFGYQNPGGIGKAVFSTVIANPNDFTGYGPQIDNLSFSTTPIPEPSTVAIALLGLGALAFRFRKM